MNIKQEICDLAYQLMTKLEECPDDGFVDEVLEAVRYNDVFALSDLQEEAEES